MTGSDWFWAVALIFTGMVVGVGLDIAVDDKPELDVSYIDRCVELCEANGKTRWVSQSGCMCDNGARFDWEWIAEQSKKLGLSEKSSGSSGPSWFTIVSYDDPGQISTIPAIFRPQCPGETVQCSGEFYANIRHFEPVRCWCKGGMIDE